MHARFFTQLWDDGRDSLSNYFLWVRLARIDHVVDNLTATEIRTRNFRLSFRVWFGCCYPGRMSIDVGAEGFVVKIEPQLSQLPKLIGDVLAGVGHRAIRTHNDLVRFMFISARVRFEWHHPATAVSSLGLEVDHVTVFH